jgi:hypothetical protein
MMELNIALGLAGRILTSTNRSEDIENVFRVSEMCRKIAAKLNSGSGIILLGEFTLLILFIIIKIYSLCVVFGNGGSLISCENLITMFDIAMRVAPVTVVNLCGQAVIDKVIR